MPGRTVTLTWTYQDRLPAPAKYRRACRYDAFVPDRLADLELHLPRPAQGWLPKQKVRSGS